LGPPVPFFGDLIEAKAQQLQGCHVIRQMAADAHRPAGLHIQSRDRMHDVNDPPRGKPAA
jgi:hypothetical protein